jgi:hypothetical protein
VRVVPVQGDEAVAYGSSMRLTTASLRGYLGSWHESRTDVEASSIGFPAYKRPLYFSV